MNIRRDEIEKSRRPRTKPWDKPTIRNSRLVESKCRRQGSSRPWGRGKARGVWSHGSQDRKVSKKEREDVLPI